MVAWVTRVTDSVALLLKPALRDKLSRVVSEGRRRYFASNGIALL